MDFLREFNRIMVEHGDIALATCVDNIPNVRIVNFYYDTKKKGIVYFSTFRDNTKVEEFSKNNTVAFTTVPTKGNEHVRVTEAVVQKSDLTIYDLKDVFVEKIPDYEMTIDQAGSQLVLYEIHFKEAAVTLDFTQYDNITL
ncbi:pyridoxamine 5'-phosphate oxidase family protein [Clostridium algidicarnis]|uniref:pyridoxamine 5'-phosphate oxidase family protein n=1 Tax=Clostridium algidicarnis TaxID=37659 RepID=UPI001CF36E7D|nr:pyridoxamine 5'-phosphate oxidase family protein [Clostridium algidicarnis]MCB2286612.1 pyridoxamine 5'-phosphate oxidase family protein [Clostridium algidicarnis]